jgi:hypothetical protein
MKKAKIGIWGACPIAVLQDDRLTHNAIKVYIALSSYQGSNERCWPSMADIGERAGIAAKKVSEATTLLENCGWIEKHRRSAKNQTNVYHVMAEVEYPEIDESVQTDYPVLGDTDYPETGESIYITKTTSENNKLSRAKKTRDIAPLSSPTARMIEETVTAIQPIETWSSIPKERSCILKLATKIEALTTKTPIQDATELAGLIIRTFVEKKRSTRQSYWADAPVIPSAILARLPELASMLSTKYTAYESATTFDMEVPF